MNLKTTLNWLKKHRSQWKWKKKINRISKGRGFKSHLNEPDRQRIYQFWNFYKSISSLKWHEVYTEIYPSEDGPPIVTFIPENAFYMEIEPTLNNFNLSKAYQDKNIYHKIFEESSMPNVILRNMHGVFYDQNYKSISSDKIKDIFSNEDKNYIVKPSLNTQQGRDVIKVRVKNGKLFVKDEEYETVDILSNIFGRDFVVQENVEQHAALSSVYEYSLNTIRLVTVRLNENIYCTSAIIRFGNDKRIVDNRGIACGISNSGQLNDYATDLNMQIYHKHPFNSAEFADLQIPKYESLKTFVKSMHEKLFYFDMVSWDIAIDENGEFKMIEYNLRGQEINFHQVNNGPLFDEHTESVLEQVYDNRH